MSKNNKETTTTQQEQNDQQKPERVSGTVVDKNGKEIKEKKTLKERIDSTPKWVRRLGLITAGAIGGALVMFLAGGRSSNDEYDDYNDDDDYDDYDDEPDNVGSIETNSDSENNDDD